MNIPSTSGRVAKVIRCLLVSGARSATLFVSPTETVRVSRKTYARREAIKSPRGVRRTRRVGPDCFPARGAPIELTVMIGRPNHEAVDFIKACKKAGEPFPVRKIQLKFPVKRK
jgi:hypothetical protein